MSTYTLLPRQEFKNEKDDRLYKTVAAYFEGEKCRVEKLIDISRLSNRVIDFFITTVCKKKRITPPSSTFDIYALYKMTLRSFGKTRFDIFKRSVEKIDIAKNGETILTTTVAQLNFMKWMISAGVCDYITDNVDFVNQMVRKCSARGGSSINT